MRKIKAALDYLERLRRIQDSGMEGCRPINRPVDELDELESVELRAHNIFDIINSSKRPAGNMLFFVMYDIESNKVRYNIAKYLIRKGCTRIQKSIFLADMDNTAYNNIRQDLTEIQSLYDNHDSIIICPVSTDMLRNMKIIGKNIDLDIIAHSRNTLFF